MSRGHSMKILLVLGALALGSIAAFGASSVAEAQVSCDDQSIGWDVSTAAEFNEAVACHNASTDATATSNIVLLADLSAESIASDAVFAPLSGGNLVIIGQGYTMRRGSSAPTDGVPVLKFATSDLSLISTIDLVIEVGPHDTAGIEHDGPSALRLVTTAITPGPAGSAATGVITSATSFNGGFDLVASSIEGVPLGLQIDRSGFGVEASTIASTGVDISAGGENGFGRVVNSTLGGPIGVRMDGGSVDVDNSTIVGDGAATSPATTDNNIVSFRSSIVNICSAGEADAFANPPVPGWTDRGFNVGDCFEASEPIALTLADNGCRRNTPLGCPGTAALFPDSPAKDAGLCLPGEPYEGDQRGFPRNPQAAGCDAGAFEIGCQIHLGSNEFSVATAVEFNQALICHNFGDNRTNIYLLDDIVAQTIDGAAVFPTIEKGHLGIFGEGHSLSRAASAGSQPAPLLSIDSPDGVSENFWALELGLELGPFDTHGILHRGSIPLFLQVLSIYPGPDGSAATGIDSTATGTTGFYMVLSSIEGLPVGLRLETEATVPAGLVIAQSTIASTGVDIDVVKSPSGVLAASTLGGPTGIQMTAGSIEVLNSTILGDGAALTSNALSDTLVTFKSSIVNACSADEVLIDTQAGPGWRDLRNNVGSCFGTPAETFPLADNGCEYVTATGCPRTAALRVSSPAIAVGDCSDEAGTDQRGEPRTPLRPGCDAGAFEFDPCSDTIDIYGGPFEVFDAGKFVTAISCFNQGASGPGDYTIRVFTDMDVDIAGQRTVINQPAPGYSLTIDGFGSTIAFTDAATPDAPPRSVLSIAPTNVAEVSIRNTDLTRDRSAGSEPFSVIRNESPATLIVGNSVVELQGGQAAVMSDGDADLIVENSIIKVAQHNDDEFPAGILMMNGDLTMNTTTMEQLRFAAGGGFSITFTGTGIDQRAGTLEVTNSTFDAVGIFTEVDVAGAVSNSTFIDGGIPGIGDLLVTSSILNECDPILTDGGSNVGACFGSLVELGNAFDNGCQVFTPDGCPRTFALAANSPARAVGDCTGGATDQRGAPRTPAGPGCDAGAYESAAPLVGDVTNDGAITNADVQALLVWLAGGDAPARLSQGDWNDDGSVKLDDALAIAQRVAAN